jgi:5-methylcytosine-specific restriction endonuclease McrA
MYNFAYMPTLPTNRKRSWQMPTTPFKDRAFINPWYNTKAWQKAAKAAKQLQPVCKQCSPIHDLIKGDVVDHTCPVSYGRTEEERQLIMWEPSNHEPMCKQAHNRKSQRESNVTELEKKQTLVDFYIRKEAYNK